MLLSVGPADKLKLATLRSATSKGIGILRSLKVWEGGGDLGGFLRLEP